MLKHQTRIQQREKDKKSLTDYFFLKDFIFSFKKGKLLWGDFFSQAELILLFPETNEIREYIFYHNDGSYYLEIIDEIWKEKVRM